MLLLIGLENFRIRTGLRAYRRCQHRPAIVLFRVRPALHLHDEAKARFQRWWRRLRWPSPTGTARAACVCHQAIADHVIAPGTWAAASPALATPLIVCSGSFRVWQAGKPPRLHLCDVGCHRLRFLCLPGGIGLGLLVCQLTRMHHHKTGRLQGEPSVAVLDLAPSCQALPMPAARRFVLGPSSLLSHEGQRGLLTPPVFELLADGTVPWD